MTDALQSMKAGKRPIKLAKGGYLFSPDELNDPQVKNKMKDNPEFSEFSIDQQNATANKMQQRFAQPEDKMNPTRGYAEGGTTDTDATPPLTANQIALNKLATDQATTMANVYGDPSKVITPATVATTPSGPDTTIAAGTGAVI